MTDEQKKTLIIGGAAGAGLGLLYLLSRGGRGGIVTVGSDTAMFESFSRNVQQFVENTLAKQRQETSEAIEATAETLRTERAGLLDTLRATFETGLGNLTNQINALLGRVSTIETKQAEFQETISELQEKVTQLPGDVVTQSQALVMERDWRMQAAMAATLGKISQWGTSQPAGAAERVAASFGQVWGLTPEQMNILKSWARSRSNELARGQIAVGGAGEGWRAPLLPAPLGAALENPPWWNLERDPVPRAPAWTRKHKTKWGVKAL